MSNWAWKATLYVVAALFAGIGTAYVGLAQPAHPAASVSASNAPSPPLDTTDNPNLSAFLQIVQQQYRLLAGEASADELVAMKVARCTADAYGTQRLDAVRYAQAAEWRQMSGDRRERAKQVWLDSLDPKGLSLAKSFQQDTTTALRICVDNIAPKTMRLAANAPPAKARLDPEPPQSLISTIEFPRPENLSDADCASWETAAVRRVQKLAKERGYDPNSVSDSDIAMQAALAYSVDLSHDLTAYYARRLLTGRDTYAQRCDVTVAGMATLTRNQEAALVDQHLLDASVLSAVNEQRRFLEKFRVSPATDADLTLKDFGVINSIEECQKRSAEGWCATDDVVQIAHQNSISSLRNGGMFLSSHCGGSTVDVDNPKSCPVRVDIDAYEGYKLFRAQFLKVRGQYLAR